MGVCKNQVYHGDCLDILPTIEKESVHLVVADPPYFIDGLCDSWKKGDKSKLKSGVVGGLPAGMKFDTKQGKALQEFINEVFEKIMPVMTPGAFAIIFSQPRLSPRMSVGIEDAGFEIRDILAWRYTKRAQFKAFSQNHFIDKRDMDINEKESLKAAMVGLKTPQLRPQYESMILAQKPKIGTFVDNWIQHKTGLINSSASHDGKAPQTVITVEKPIKEKYNCHLTVKPVLLIEHLINLLSMSGQTVLDPFLGSGTTAMASKKTGRDCIGIEINKDYYDIAQKRIKEVVCL